MKIDYIPHDCNTMFTPQMQEIIMEHGMAGYGVYWAIYEMLCKYGGRLPLRLIRSMAFSMHTEPAVVESVIKDFGLFKFNDEEFYSEEANKQIEKIKEKSAKARESANAKQTQSERNANAKQTQSERNANAKQTQSERNANAKQTQSERNAIKEKEKEKEKVLSSSSSSLPLDEEIENVKADNTWIDYICMNHNIVPAKLFTMLGDFKAECIANGIERHRDIADVKSHINNWLRIQGNKTKNKRNEDSNTNKRRGIDVSDNADYSGEHF